MPTFHVLSVSSSPIDKVGAPDYINFLIDQAPTLNGTPEPNQTQRSAYIFGCIIVGQDYRFTTQTFALYSVRIAADCNQQQLLELAAKFRMEKAKIYVKYGTITI